jgi:two-component system, chemotaxis family, response regulator Rcp1
LIRSSLKHRRRPLDWRQSSCIDRAEETARINIGRGARARELQMPTWEGYAPLQLLLVEDSPGDVRLTLEAFRWANPSVKLHVATDGAEAVAFLWHQGKHHSAPRPDLILLDLNLPKMDGRAVLALIKEDSALKTIPTVVLTTSAANEDVVKSYQLQANCYLTKPLELNEFEALVESINDFWLKKARLPYQPSNE